MNEATRITFEFLKRSSDLIIANCAFSDDFSKVAAGIYLGLSVGAGSGRTIDVELALFEKELPRFLSFVKED